VYPFWYTAVRFSHFLETTQHFETKLNGSCHPTHSAIILGMSSVAEAYAVFLLFIGTCAHRQLSRCYSDSRELRTKPTGQFPQLLSWGFSLPTGANGDSDSNRGRGFVVGRLLIKGGGLLSGVIVAGGSVRAVVSRVSVRAGLISGGGAFVQTPIPTLALDCWAVKIISTR